MTAPIIQQQQQPSSTQNSNSVEEWNSAEGWNSTEGWNNYDWTPSTNNVITIPNFNSEDYEEMVQNEVIVQESNGEMVQEGNEEMVQEEEEEYISDESSSYTSESTSINDLPELEETSNIFENPANSLNWRDRHIERNFCSYNEFHDYITAYRIEYNEYFGLSQQ